MGSHFQCCPFFPRTPSYFLSHFLRSNPDDDDLLYYCYYYYSVISPVPLLPQPWRNVSKFHRANFSVTRYSYQLCWQVMARTPEFSNAEVLVVHDNLRMSSTVLFRLIV